MMIRFPYEKINLHERIIIYGAGGLGQNLFWQIRSGHYCTIVGIVDRQFGDDVKPPFYPVKKINSLSYDKIIIASASATICSEIKKDLEKLGIPIDKIIADYPFDDIGFPALPTAIEFVQQYDFFKGLIDICNSSKSEFAGNFVYQSYPALGIEGKRDTTERMQAYQMENYLTKEDTLLDIGCNCGFFDISVAPLVKNIKGVDVDDGLIGMAEYVRKKLGIHNASFHCRDVFQNPLNEKFDAVCIFAVHLPILMHSDMSEADFIFKVLDLLKDNGTLFFESHSYLPKQDDTLYRKLDTILRDSGMSLIAYKRHYGKTAGNCNRDISIYRHF